MKNNGHYSDFFWAINSNFDLSRIYYDFKNKSVVKNLVDCDIKLVDGPGINKAEALEAGIKHLEFIGEDGVTLVSARPETIKK